MKKATFFILFYIFVVGLVGCNNTPPMLIQEVNLQALDKDSKHFVDNLKNRAGLYLYSPAGEKKYLVINYSSVKQGEEARFLISINAEVLDQTLIISIEDAGTHNYHDERLENIRIYSLSSDIEYEKIQMFINGKEASFDLVGG